MNMKKLLQWKYLFLTAAALGLAAALATLPLNGNETRAEPAKTPNPWSELPEETPPEPTPEPDWAPTPGIVHAVFPSRRGLAPAVRHFLDFLGESMPGRSSMATRVSTGG